MSTAKIFAVENRLAKIARQPGGRTFNEAVKSAELKVDSVRAQSLAALKVKAAELSGAADAAKSNPSQAQFDDLYRMANAIYGLAGTFGLKGLSEASASLCDLIEGGRNGETLAFAAIIVHADGIRLLANTGEAAAGPVLEGLRQVHARFAPPT